MRGSFRDLKRRPSLQHIFLGHSYQTTERNREKTENREQKKREKQRNREQKKEKNEREQRTVTKREKQIK